MGTGDEVEDGRMGRPRLVSQARRLVGWLPYLAYEHVLRSYR